MKKNTFNKIINILFNAVLAVTAAFCAFKPKNFSTAKADVISEKKLQYFKLEKPIDVFREEQTVYIAQKDLIVIYYDDTYRTLKPSTAYYEAYGERCEFNISSMSKCGNALLFLSNEKLYAVELSSFSISKTPLLNGVSAFSVNGNRFIASVSSETVKQIKFYKYNSSSGELFSEFFPDYAQTTINGKGAPSSLALVEANDENKKAAYYFGSEELYVSQNKDILHVSDQTPTALEYADDKLYVRAKAAASDIVYLLEGDYSLTPILSLNENGLNGANGFFVLDEKMLVCDTERNRVVEFDVATKTFTDFEICFTKIDLPNDFAITHTATPMSVSVSPEDALYNVNLSASANNGYFVFSGSYKPNGKTTSSEYLVAATVGSDYYLILGDCMALVLKDDYEPTPIATHDGNGKKLVFTNDCAVYKLPYKTADKTLDPGHNSENDAAFFKAFAAKRGTEATVISTLTLRGIEFTYLSCEQGKGYIPSACLTEKTEEAPARSNFKTATTARKTTYVYSDSNLSTVAAELPSYSDVLVYSTDNGVCYVSYGNGEYGYIEQGALEKRGDFAKRMVAVCILLALSVCLTAVYFENKYLFSKKKD